MNIAALSGRLVAAPELRYTPTGDAVATFRIAVDRKRNAEGETTADFFTVVVWKKLAEVCAAHLAKGQEVIVVGQLRTRSWTTGDGNKRHAVELHASSVEFGRKPAGATTKEEAVTADAASTPDPLDFGDLPF